MRFISLSLLASAAALTGCASIVNGQNQSLSVEARTDSGPVVGANCTLMNNKGTWFVTTPGSATVQRSFEDMSVKCQKDAMEPGLTTVKSATKGMAFGNILFGGFIGAGVDVATGAAYDYPVLISVNMGKPLALATAATAVSPVAPMTAASGVPTATSPVVAVATAPMSAASATPMAPVAVEAPPAPASAAAAMR